MSDHPTDPETAAPPSTVAAETTAAQFGPERQADLEPQVRPEPQPELASQAGPAPKPGRELQSGPVLQSGPGLQPGLASQLGPEPRSAPELQPGPTTPRSASLTDAAGSPAQADSASASGTRAAGGPQHDEPDEAALRLAEALVFASATPVLPRTLSQLLPPSVDTDQVIAALRARYAGRGVELVDAGGGIQFRTSLDLAPALRKVIDVPRRLPRVAMETLAIIAYHQPVSRPEIEQLRGTSLSQQTLDALLEANLVEPKGRRESPGRPTLWGTTPQFLAQFGLKDLRDLPRREDLLVEPPRPEPSRASPADNEAPAHNQAAPDSESAPDNAPAPGDAVPVPPGQVPAGQVPPGQVPPGQVPPGQVPAGQAPPGQLPADAVAPGQVPSGPVPPGPASC